jgi:pSer/pThr/pTyr-binding forkhead associated (FHA) protein
VLRFSNGAEVVLNKPVIAGRAPRAERVTGSELPTLVTLPSPEQEISSSHVEVRLDGWHVLVVDLGSTNGTVATVPGQRPERLRPGEPFSIPPGTTVALADEASAVYEAS